MKAETILKFIKLPEGVEFDLTQLDIKGLEDEWNRQYNGMKKLYGEEVETKTKQDLLSKYGLEKEEDIKVLQDSTKNKEELENETLTNLQSELETIKSTLAEKDAELTKTNNISLLSNLGIKKERLDKAYKLISSDLTEETDFKTLAESFIKDTPEWVGTNKPSIDLGDDNDNDDDTGKNEASDLEKAW